MLYDPKWEKKIETKADPFDLRTLVAWLETKSPQEEYNYYNCAGICMVGQYMTGQGIPWDNDKFCEFVAHGFNRIACGYPRTFGAALGRARRLLSSTK